MMEEQLKRQEAERSSRVYQQKMETMKILMDEITSNRNTSEVDKLKQIYDYLGETEVYKNT